MSRKADVLFCKIAITNGVVSQAQAQKVLALCDKKEQEAGRRPMIGAVFERYDLLRSQEVQKIYQAVNKRLGGGTVATRTNGRALGTGTGTRGRRGKGRGGGRGGGGKRREKAKRPIDQQTLYTGIAFGVIFLGVIVTILVMFYSDDSEPAKAAKDAEKKDKPVAVATLAKSVAAPNAEEEAVEEQELPRDMQQQINSILADARISRDQPEQAIKILEKLQKDLKSRGIRTPPEVLSELKLVRELLKEAGSQPEEEPATEAKDADVGDPLADEPEEEPAAEEEEPEPAAEEEESSEEEDEVEGELDELEGELDDLEGELDEG